ncbi:30S ribosomal protein S5 [Candidatus Parcubacteria bacterium]|nr:30S ribosomal protein S5 [Patescibacteria group bacterium]MBU4466494.1 30S ribosomal protein S5 [Patescibacteria group bacterium]MCG2688235.1 30S ribosomal protein S5 [Candidatus Parcubacteria bacterium]
MAFTKSFGGAQRGSKFGGGRRAFVKPVSEYDSKLLDLARVTRVTAGGKHMRFRSVVVVGNMKGKVGVGVSKGLDVQQSVQKATKLAKKNLIEVLIVNDTIPHEVHAKYGPARIMLKPQRQGRGLVAGGTVRTICLLAGIKNISSKQLGRTNNKLNNAQATIAALKKLKLKVIKNAVTPSQTNS